MLSSLFVSIRRTIYQILGFFDKVFSLKTNLFVLCYHSISNDNWRFSVSKENFLAQISWLKANYEITDYAQFSNYLTTKTFPKKPTVLITFDDGYKNILDIVPELKRIGVKPTAFVLSEPQQAIREELGSNNQLLSVAEIKILQSAGWTIGCHSATHPNFWELNTQQIEEEINTSRHRLETVLSTNVSAFAFPKGRYTPEIIEAVKNAKYDYGFSMDDGLIGETTNRYRLPRIGVDNSHSLPEFKTLMSPANIFFRNIIKKSPIGKFLV